MTYSTFCSNENKDYAVLRQPLKLECIQNKKEDRRVEVITYITIYY